MFIRDHQRSPIGGQQDFTWRVVAVPAKFRDRRIELRGPRRELIARDGRFMLTRTDRRGDHTAIQWEICLSSIERYWSVFIPGGEGSPNRQRITIRAAGGKFEFTVLSRDGADLLSFLGDQTPHAVRVRGLPKYRAVDLLRFAWEAAVLAVVLIAFVHPHSGGSSTPSAPVPPPVTRVSVGECLDPFGQRADCQSSMAVVTVRRCSEVNAADRSSTASSIAGLPWLSHLAGVAASGRMCLTLGA